MHVNITVDKMFCHMVAPTFNKNLGRDYIISSPLLLLSNGWCHVSNPSPSHIPPSKIAPRWLISSLALEGVCLKPSGLWTSPYTLSRSPFFFPFSHTRHLRSRLPNELKQSSRVLHAEKFCVLADTYHLIRPGRGSPNKEIYVRAEECQ